MAAMPELEQKLSQANRDIVEAHGRIDRQRHLIHRLSANGSNVTDAENLLRRIEEGSEAMQTHRRQIVRELSSAGEEID
jgi:hypothetical protein